MGVVLTLHSQKLTTQRAYSPTSALSLRLLFDTKTRMFVSDPYLECQLKGARCGRRVSPATVVGMLAYQYKILTAGSPGRGRRAALRSYLYPTSTGPVAPIANSSK